MCHAWMRRILSAVLILSGFSAFAQDYPTKSVKLLVPFAPGGPTDVLARLMAQKLTDC